jgi:uridine kinase
MRADAPVLIGIAGGSGSGKTYLARRLQSQVGADKVAVLSMDQYFRSLSDAERAVDPRDINFDHPSRIDVPLLLAHLQALRAGERVLAPSYDFRDQVQQSSAIAVGPAPVIVVEGLFILNTPIVDLFDLRIFLEVDADQRLIGRLLRDLDERDGDVRWNIDRYQRFVRPGHANFVEPTRLRADVVVDFTHRRIFFQELLTDMVRDYVTSRFDMLALLRSVRSDRYLPGVQLRDEQPPAAAPAPGSAPTLFVGDNPQR